MASSIVTTAPLSAPTPPSNSFNTAAGNGLKSHGTPPGHLSNVILIAKFDYKANESTELDLKKGERLFLIDNSKNWWLVRKLDSDLTGYVPSNYVKKEKKSIFDKLLSRKLPFSSNNGSSGGGGGGSNNSSPSAPSSTQHHSISPPGRSPTSANGAASVAPLSPNHVQVIKYNANKLGSSDNGVRSTNGYSPSAAVTTTSPAGNKAVVKHKYKALKPDELTLNVGVRVNILEKFGDGWWRVNVFENESESGLYPSNYLQEETSSCRSPLADQDAKSPNGNSNGNTSHNNGNYEYKNGKYESLSSSERDIEFVRVIYPHTAARNNGVNGSDYVNGDQAATHPIGELSVGVNEVLKLIDDDSEEDLDFDKSWVKVFNSQGVTGMIPSSCVQPIITDSTNGSGGDFVFIRRPTCMGMFANEPWYYGNISRVETNALLNKYGQNGDFILRDSEREAGNFSISLKSDSPTNKHFKIIFTAGKFLIGKRVFDKMDDLLDYYHQNPIFDQKPERLFLIKPFEPPHFYSL